MADFRFFKMAAAANLDFGNFKFFTVGTLTRVELRLRAKFCRNCKTAAEIWQFFHFSRWRPSAILDFQKLEISTSSPIRRQAQYASPYQISRRSVKPFRRYGRFSIFQDGGRRHLGFWKFQIFNSCDAPERRTASACQILSKSVKPRLRYGDFSIFQDGGRPPSWIGFTRGGIIHEEYLVVFETMQNSVVISAEISTVCQFCYSYYTIIMCMLYYSNHTAV